MLVFLLLHGATGTAVGAPLTLGVHAADHSVAPPFGNLLPTDPIRPSVTLEAELHALEGAALSLRPAARLSGHVHGHAGSGWRLTAGLTGRVTSAVGLFAETGLEVGLIHTLWGSSLAFGDGGYTASADPGRLGGVGGVVLGTGLDLDRLDGPPLALVVSYRWFVHSGWMPVLDVVPKAELGVGMRWTLSGRAS